jgi:uncharacterized membrane protein
VKKMAQSYVYSGMSSLVLLIPAAVILVIAFFLLRKRCRFDSRFFLLLLPFTLLGGTIRALADKGILPYNGNPFSLGYYTHTPGLWLMGGLFLLLLLWLLASKPKALEGLQRIGWMLLAISLLVFFGTGFSGLNGIILVILFFFVLFFAWILVQRKTHFPFLRNDLNFFAFSTNAMDAAASLVAFVFLDCFPKHQATGEWIQISPLFFVVAKIVFILVALWLIERVLKKEQLQNFAKISLGLFWVMTGFRTVLVIGAGLCGAL